MFKTIFEEKFDEGFAEGRLEALAEAEAKVERGKIESRQETILLILADQFDGVPRKLEEKIQKITDIEKLNQLSKLTARCKSLEEFEKALD